MLIGVWNRVVSGGGSSQVFERQEAQVATGLSSFLQLGSQGPSGSVSFCFIVLSYHLLLSPGLIMPLPYSRTHSGSLLPVVLFFS